MRARLRADAKADIPMKLDETSYALVELRISRTLFVLDRETCIDIETNIERENKARDSSRPSEPESFMPHQLDGGALRLARSSCMYVEKSSS